MRSPESTATDADDLIRLGRIATVDLVAARITVTVDEATDDGGGATGEAVTGPIRWIEGRAGETRTWSPPSVGEEVVLLCPAGNIGSAVALRGLNNADAPAPGNDATHLIRFSDAALVSYDPQGHALAITLPAGATMAITAPGGLSIEADTSINGNVTVTGTLNASTDVVGGGKSLKGHKHTGVQTGSGQTGAPA